MLQDQHTCLVLVVCIVLVSLEAYSSQRVKKQECEAHVNVRASTDQRAKSALASHRSVCLQINKKQKIDTNVTKICVFRLTNFSGLFTSNHSNSNHKAFYTVSLTSPVRPVRSGQLGDSQHLYKSLLQQWSREKHDPSMQQVQKHTDKQTQIIFYYCWSTLLKTQGLKY